MGARILWIAIFFTDPKQKTEKIAFVNQSYGMITSVFDPNETEASICITADTIPAQPHCWEELLQRARDVGGCLGVFAR
jgi:hypothetical protein